MRKTILYVLMVSLFAGAFAQDAAAQNDFKVLSKSELDSIARPKLAEGADKLEFSSTVCDLGKIKEDDGIADCSFSFVWKGAQAAAITKIQTTCSCLRAESTVTTLKQETEGTVKSFYNPKRHFGKTHQRIFVYTTLSDVLPSAALTVDCEIIPSSDKSKDYAFAKGALLLKRDAVTIERTSGKAVERTVCLNSSDKALRITAQKDFLPKGISFRTDPESIEPGCEGELVITWDRSKADSLSLTKSEAVILMEGLDTPPSQRTIKIRFKDK